MPPVTLNPPRLEGTPAVPSPRVAITMDDLDELAYRLTGPTTTGAHILQDGRLMVASFTAHDIGEASCRSAARLAARGPSRQMLLEWIAEELRHDDDGTRYQELLALIQGELSRAAG